MKYSWLKLPTPKLSGLCGAVVANIEKRVHVLTDIENRLVVTKGRGWLQ